MWSTSLFMFLSVVICVTGQQNETATTNALPANTLAIYKAVLDAENAIRNAGGAENILNTYQGKIPPQVKQFLETVGPAWDIVSIQPRVGPPAVMAGAMVAQAAISAIETFSNLIG